jgi:putative Mn2+ efflux pump MntP
MDLQLGFVLGLDNVAVALALGPLGLSAPRTALLAGLFGASEALMPLAGSAFGAGFGGSALVGDANAVRVTVLATLATMVLGLTLVRRDPAALVGNPAMPAALAALLGLDNFAAGVTDTAPGFALATSGLVSGALAFVACLASGAIVQRVAHRPLPVASTVMLAVLAVAGLV